MNKIFLGLPEYLHDKVLWVAREFRTNPLSHEPGGSDVIVEYHNNKVYGYDWIKFPSYYISKIWNEGISKIYINYEEFDTDKQLIIIKENIKRIYARKYERANFESESFKEIWNSATSNKLPWEILKEFDEHQGFQSGQIEKAIQEEALNEYLERQINSSEYEKYLIDETIRGRWV